jgi:hypothetical protein
MFFFNKVLDAHRSDLNDEMTETSNINENGSRSRKKNTEINESK